MAWVSILRTKLQPPVFFARKPFFKYFFCISCVLETVSRGKFLHLRAKASSFVPAPSSFSFPPDYPYLHLTILLPSYPPSYPFAHCQRCICLMREGGLFLLFPQSEPTPTFAIKQGRRWPQHRVLKTGYTAYAY